MTDEVLDDLPRQEMEKTIARASRRSSRTCAPGARRRRSSTGITVEYYGAQDAAQPARARVGARAAPARDPAVRQERRSTTIEKAIQQSDLGLNPQNDGKLIRVPIPALTEERRRDLVKHVRKVAEEYRVSVRNHRRDAIEMLKELEKDKEITEDDRRHAHEKVEALTKEYVERLDKISRPKKTRSWRSECVGARPPTSTRLPRHVAVIMDGNGRWARAARPVAARRAPARQGLGARRRRDEPPSSASSTCSLFAFSTENWKRPPREVDGLMALLRRYLRDRARQDDEERDPAASRSATCAACRRPCARRCARRIEATKRQHRHDGRCSRVSYGGREDIAQRGARDRPRACSAASSTPDAIDEDTVAEHLGTAGIPDPDLLIRTSGEMRISNFFLWQLAYTEIYVTETLWPDFREREFLQALAHFQQRERRFGRIAAQIERERLRAASASERARALRRAETRLLTAAVAIPALWLIV